MHCPKCHKEMKVEDYHTDYFDNDEQVKLIEQFWCPWCDVQVAKTSYYKKYDEEVEEV